MFIVLVLLVVSMALYHPINHCIKSTHFCTVYAHLVGYFPGIETIIMIYSMLRS